MQITLMVMSQVPEQLNTERFVEYLSGLHLFPPHQPLDFSFSAAQLDNVWSYKGEWSILTFTADVNPAPYVQADVFLVVLSNDGSWITTNASALELANSLQPERWANTGSFLTPLMGITGTGFQLMQVPPENLVFYLNNSTATQ